jgi:hypothetical protein
MKEFILLSHHDPQRWWRNVFFILSFAFLNCWQAFSQFTSQWFTRAPLPIPRQEIPHAVLEGKIYIPGEFISGGFATNIVEVFQLEVFDVTGYKVAALAAGRFDPAFMKCPGRLRAYPPASTSTAYKPAIIRKPENCF